MQDKQLIRMIPQPETYIDQEWKKNATRLDLW